ncbi:DDE transposase family protein [Rothia amarae]|uniref:DDE transposase family protein n=1 Tax=Rothia amarae TaxID=169480 RepID=A0A7H2BIA7_9MICC|nr:MULTISPECIES: DDE transposase family protein [Rothia]QNV39403.1 DDE transposase family protein [Rothia amarae]
MPHQRTTGLIHQQFTKLLTALTHHITWGKPGSNPTALTLPQAQKATLLYHRNNITEELLAELFNTSPPTISRTIITLE